MSDSNAPYAALSTDEKLSLSSPPAYSPHSLESTTPEPLALADSSHLLTRRRRRRAILFSFLTLLAGSVLLAAGAGAGAFGGICGGGTREMREAVVAPAAVERAAEADDGGMKLVKRAQVGEREMMKREFTAIPDFIAAQASIVAAAATSSSSSTSPSASPTFSTSIYENGQTSTFVYTTRPIVNPGGYTIGTLTGYVHQTATPSATNDEALSLSTIPFSPTAIPTPRVKLAKRSEGEGQVRFDPEQGGEEWTTSVDKRGNTQVLVKTTRPIVNPAGMTVGTLDGVYVKPRPTPVVPVAAYHSELKRSTQDLEEELA